jgi:hypothetical protein
MLHVTILQGKQTMFVSFATELQITFSVMGKIVLPLEQLTYEWVFGLYLVRTSRAYCEFEVEPKIN